MGVDIMLHTIFPNQLTHTQTKELRSKKLFIVSGFKEINNAARDMKTSILKDGINTSANLFHFCEVKDIFKFIHWETWVRRVIIPEDDSLIFDMAGFNYIPKLCYTRCDTCNSCLKKDCNPHSSYIYNKDLGGYLAPQVFLERRKFIWEPKTIKYLMALGADPNLINHRAVEDLIKYGNFESFKLFYDKTNCFETSGLSHENIWWVPVSSRLEKLSLLALLSTRYDRRNYLRFLIEQGLDIHALGDKLLKEAFNCRVIQNSITCFKYLYNLEPTYFNNLEWFTKEVNFWFKKPEDKEAFFESLKFTERVRVVRDKLPERFCYDK
jgi:hypothetical protein